VPPGERPRERDMSSGSGNPLTVMLAAAERGDAEARERLWQSVYSELHRMAESMLAGDGARRLLQPTTLIHEAYLRLVGDGDVAWNSRGHFFSAAARAMRRICVDYARSNRALKRGGGWLEAYSGTVSWRHEATKTRRHEGIRRMGGRRRIWWRWMRRWYGWNSSIRGRRR